MAELHNYGLARCSKKTGKIDTTMTAIGKGVIQMWALQNTPKGKVSVVVDIDEHRTVAEYIGTERGFPRIHKTEEAFEFNVPEELYKVFEEEVEKREKERNAK